MLEQVGRDYQAWRHSISQSDFARLVAGVTDFYKTIPTQLPRNLRDTLVMEQVVLGHGQDLSEQETRLNQLEAALSTYTVPGTMAAASPTLYDRLGARITALPENDDAYARTGRLPWARPRVTASLSACAISSRSRCPAERAAFAANTVGTELVLRTTHGTNNANLRHILHDRRCWQRSAGTGAPIPNGWMFGAGIYFANIASQVCPVLPRTCRQPPPHSLCCNDGRGQDVHRPSRYVCHP